MRIPVLIGMMLSSYFSCFSQSSQSFYDVNFYAVDLSEDMSVMSSKNDELVVLIYEKDSATILDSPLHVYEFVLDTGTHEKQIKDLQFSKSEYLLFLVELDDERTVEQIDPVIRVYFNKIISLYSKKSYQDLQRYFGDNDLIGYAALDLTAAPVTKEMEFKGRQSMDSFHFKIKMSKTLK